MLGTEESEVNESTQWLRADKEGVASGVGRGAWGVGRYLALFVFSGH